MTKQNVTYKGHQFKVDVDYPVRGPCCDCCKKKGFVALHHLKYAYPIAEVRKNHMLALDNTICLCYTCHELANSMRKLLDADDKVLERLTELVRLKTNLPPETEKI